MFVYVSVYLEFIYFHPINFFKFTSCKIKAAVSLKYQFSSLFAGWPPQISLASRVASGHVHSWIYLGDLPPFSIILMRLRGFEPNEWQGSTIPPPLAP